MALKALAPLRGVAEAGDNDAAAAGGEIRDQRMKTIESEAGGVTETFVGG